MDMGITNISRIIGRTDPELEPKKPQPVEKTAEARSVSGNEAQDDSVKATNDDLSPAKLEQNDMGRSGLEEVANKINDLFQTENRSLQFTVDEASGRTIISVVDTDTGDLIKQIPAEELLEISRKLAAQLEGDEAQASSGMLVKSKA